MEEVHLSGEDDSVAILICIYLLTLPTLLVLGRLSVWLYRQLRQQVARRRLQRGLHRDQPLVEQEQGAGSSLDNRVALEVYLFTQTNYGFYLDGLNALVSISSCVLFVVDTYRVPGSAHDTLWTTVDEGVELFFGSYFFVDYFFRLYLAQDRLRHYFSPMALIDIITLFPFVLRVLFGGVSLSGGGESVQVLRMLRIIRMARVLRIFRLERSFSGLSHLVFRIALTLLCLVFCAAGFFWVFETAEDMEGSVSSTLLPFHRAVYYCLIETVGRPRIPAGTLMGTFVLYALVISASVLIPRQVASLLDAMRADSFYRRTVVPAPNRWFSAGGTKRHVIVTGSITFHGLHDFLFQFFHPDHGVAVHDTIVVIVSPASPSDDMRSLLRHPLLEKRVIYIQGTLNNTADVARARIFESSTVIVLANKGTAKPEQEDLAHIAAVLAIKSEKADLPVVVELILRRNQKFLHGLPSWNPKVDVTLCLVELSYRIAARGALHPGFGTLLSNLFTSSSGSDVSLEGTAEAHLVEYNHGKSQEIYRVELTPGFVGRSWTAVQLSVYIRFNVMFIALAQISSTDQGGSHSFKAKTQQQSDDRHQGNLDVSLAPEGDYLIRPGDKAFVIASSAQHAMLVTSEARAPGAADRFNLWAWRGKEEDRPNSRLVSRRRGIDINRGAIVPRSSPGVRRASTNHPPSSRPRLPSNARPKFFSFSLNQKASREVAPRARSASLSHGPSAGQRLDSPAPAARRPSSASSIHRRAKTAPGLCPALCVSTEETAQGSGAKHNRRNAPGRLRIQSPADDSDSDDVAQPVPEVETSAEVSGLQSRILSIANHVGHQRALDAPVEADEQRHPVRPRDGSSLLTPVRDSGILSITPASEESSVFSPKSASSRRAHFSRRSSGALESGALSPATRSAVWQRMLTLSLGYAQQGDLRQMVQDQVALLRGVTSTGAPGEGSPSHLSSQTTSERSSRLSSAVPSPSRKGPGSGLSLLEEDAGRVVAPESEAGLLRDHIVIMTEAWQEGIDSLLRSLLANEHEMRTVVLLCPDLEDKVLTERLRQYPDVQLVEGSAQAEHSLKRCRVASAFSVIIVSNQVDESQEANAGDTAANGASREAVMQDSNAVLTTLAVRARTANRKTHIFTMLHDGSNVRFFDVRIDLSSQAQQGTVAKPYRWQDKLRRKQTAQPSGLTTIAREAMRKSTLRRTATCGPGEMKRGSLLSRLSDSPAEQDSSYRRQGPTPLKASSADQSANAPALLANAIDKSVDFAAGRVFSPTLMDKLLSEAYYNPNSSTLLTLLVDGDFASQRMLFRVDVESEFAGSTWRDMVIAMLQRDRGTPIALYRSADKVSYVYTLPDQDTVVGATDAVFIIGTPTITDDDPSTHVPSAH